MSAEDRSRPALLFLVASTAVLAAVAIAFTATKYPLLPTGADGLPLLVLAILSMLSEGWTHTRLRSGDVSTSFPFTVAAIVLFGPTAGALFGILGALLTVTWRQKPSAIKSVFNVSAVALADLAAGWAYVLLGGLVLAGRYPVALNIWPKLLLPILAMSVVGPAVNVALIALVVWVSAGVPMLETFRGVGFGLILLVHFCLALLGLAMVEVVGASQYVGLLLFVFPLLTARQVFTYYARLDEDYPATLKLLVTVIEAKDDYTRGHSERVAEYALEFANYLGLGAREVERIYQAAMLHDLGKMAVRLEVINKPSKLTDDEYDEMKQHPLRAVELVSHIPGTARILPTIRHHHERIDGAGYPDGLASTEIPFDARILAVCDTYDAMTSSRPYRSAIASDVAIAELESVANHQLDAALVGRFAEMIRESQSDSPKAGDE